MMVHLIHQSNFPACIKTSFSQFLSLSPFEQFRWLEDDPGVLWPYLRSLREGQRCWLCGLLEPHSISSLILARLAMHTWLELSNPQFCHQSNRNNDISLKRLPNTVIIYSIAWMLLGNKLLVRFSWDCVLVTL